MQKHKDQFAESSSFPCKVSGGFPLHSYSTKRNKRDTQRLRIHTELWGHRHGDRGEHLHDVCPSGWRRFSTNCYYISTEEKTWSDSRQACMQIGADLAIISSREEQDFFEGQSGDFWIGLSDREREGTWKWVDGTTIPVEKGYWRANPQQPDNYGGNEDCVEFNTVHSVPFQRWNDRPCDDNIKWICESVPKC
uniref:C-type lectin domain-containing protein n=1 Tax=Paramormyrops kingsleyae TaxID=1676925 RepID=A0A3B3RBZ0_9TELE